MSRYLSDWRVDLVDFCVSKLPSTTHKGCDMDVATVCRSLVAFGASWVLIHCVVLETLSSRFRCDVQILGGSYTNLFLLSLIPRSYLWNESQTVIWGSMGMRPVDHLEWVCICNLVLTVQLMRKICLFFVRGELKPTCMRFFLYFDTHRVVLKDMCVQFLECCFNPLMRVVRVCNVWGVCGACN